jgi:small basic protein
MATRADIVIDQGTTFSTILNLTDQNGDMLNLSGYIANSQIKQWYTSYSSVTMNAVVNSLSGQITLSLTANQTANMWPGRYVYDVIVTDSSNNVSRIVEGEVTLNAAVTNETLETYSNTVSYESYFGNTNFTPV